MRALGCMLALGVALALCLACKKPAAEEKPAASEPWAAWASSLSSIGEAGGATNATATLDQLAARARADKRLTPFRKRGKQRAVEESQRYLEQIRTAPNSPGLLVPPVDWGLVPQNDPNTLMKQNEWRPLIAVAWAHYHTGQARYLDQLEQVALDWIDFNLVNKRKNSMRWHDMATGLRSTLLAYLIQERLRGPVNHAQALPKLIWGASKHAEVLAKPNKLTQGNHGLYVLVGLKALVTVLPELKNAQHWGRYADTKMNAMLKTRYSEQGFHFEHSPGYQAVTNNSLRDIVASKLFKIDPAIDKRLKAARHVTYRLYHPNGDRVAIGDTDRGSGKHIAEVASIRQFLQTEGERGKAPETGLLADPEVGYVTFRSPWSEKPFAQHSFLFFAPGYHSSHHKHRDHLSFEWSEAGHPILVDSGKYAYVADKWRRFFESTRAGNAVEIDGKDHSNQTQHAWGGGLNAAASIGPLQFMQAKVQYARSKVSHRRSLVLYPRRWLCLIDEMSAKKSHVYRQWLQLHEDFQVSQQGEVFQASVDKSLKVFIQSLVNDTELEQALGEVKPRIQGWRSVRSREKRQRTSVAFRRQGEGEHFVTLLSLDKPATQARVEEMEGGVRIRFARGNQRHELQLTDGKLNAR